MMAQSGFTPLSGLAGGFFIGSAAAGLLLFNGDILGASSIVSSVALAPRKGPSDPLISWELPFLATFMSTANLFFASQYIDSSIGTDLKTPILSSFGYSLAGLLVGAGTRLGGGCTSGHGICGLGRTSTRSFVAVVIFMMFAICTATLCSPISDFARHTSFLRGEQIPTPIEPVGTILTLLVAVAAVIPRSFLRSYLMPSRDAAVEPNDDKLPLTNISGCLFAFGLAMSGMVLPSKVYAFLDLSGILDDTFDPTLSLVVLGGVLISCLSYQFVEGQNCIKTFTTLKKPIASSASFSIPPNIAIDWPLVVGASLFGIGWGLGGLCPGPAIFLAAVGVDMVIAYWWPAFFAGAFLADKILSARNARKKKSENMVDKSEYWMTIV